jgi:hypothetical protein
VVDNCIIAGNFIENPPDTGVDVFGNVSTQGSLSDYDLIGQKEGSAGWGPNSKLGTAANPLDPGLDPNGPMNWQGPTATIKLLGGVGYRAGDPGLLVTTDQRGFTRRTYVSMGAFDPDAT